MKRPEDTCTAELPGLPPPRDMAPIVADLAEVLPVPADSGYTPLPPLQPQPEPDLFVPAPWRMALDAAIAADPAGKAGVALRLGVSRPYVSRICTGHIPVASPRFIDRVAATYMLVDCPHLGHSIAPDACRTYAARSYAQISGFEVDHWRACRGCAHNPERAQPQGTAANAGAAA